MAQDEFANTGRNVEIPLGTNSNFYSGILLTGSTGSECYSGFRKNEWCADFSRFVWSAAGVSDLTGLDSWAYSFYKYGQAHGTWHPNGSGYTPLAGDAVIFDWGLPWSGNTPAELLSDIDHVGLVESYDNGVLWTIEGNSGTNSDRMARSNRSWAIASGNILGFIAPSDAGSSPSGPARTYGDYDGDGKADPSVYRPSEGNWYVARSQGGQDVLTYGLSGDVMVPGDYDGDGRTDKAFYRPSDGNWYVAKTTGGQGIYAYGGQSGDIPVPADYDGDGKTDYAIYRTSEGKWYVARSTGGQDILTFGLSGDVMVPGDYDGDGQADKAVYRPSNGTWYVARTTGGLGTYAYGGQSGDIPVPADYDGDGKTDYAIYRTSEGNWYVARSTGGQDILAYGVTGDVLAPGDYDGDHKADKAVYRPSNGTWYVAQTTGGQYTLNYGVSGDVAVTRVPWPTIP